MSDEFKRIQTIVILAVLEEYESREDSPYTKEKLHELRRIMTKELGLEPDTLYEKGKTYLEIFGEFWRTDRRKLIDDFLSNPGTLIFVPYAAQFVLDTIWNDFVERENIMEDPDFPDDTMNCMIFEYVYKAIELKPQFISVDPKILDFEKYYNQAVSAYCHELNGASLIICCSFLEMALKEKMNELELDPIDLRYEVNDKGVKTPIGVCFNFSNIINKAYEENIIDKNDRNTLHRIRKLRNDVIHEDKEITSEKSLETIMQMKTVFEHLFKDEKSSA